MTPNRPRIDWLSFAFLFALAGAALLFACVIGAGVVHVGQRILAALWPWVQTHSDELTLGLAIGVSLGAAVALALEDGR
jgi:prepilin signal peptidase PulO-like enzyme (type II secretory pathway)